MTTAPDSAPDLAPAQIRSAVLRMEYDGARYSGWAKQRDRPSIEGELKRSFADVACSVQYMMCAGRTDAGVHALAQVVIVKWIGPVRVERLAAALNGMLPDDIIVVAASESPEGFDPRRDATSRAYEYRILNRRFHAPLRDDRVLHHPRKLDLDLLDACAAAIQGKHDFTAFTPARTLHRHFNRTILESRWVHRGDELVYCIRGDAFLRNMVRVLVGTMLAVARGERSLASFTTLLEGGPRRLGGATAPPHALCFVDVRFGEPLVDASVAPATGTHVV